MEAKQRPKATFFDVCCQCSVKQQKKIKFCVNCDCPWLYTNEVTECDLLSMLLRQLFSSLFRPL